MPAFLIVDADRNFRDALAIELRLDGHAAATAADVEEARARLAAGRFDCCIADAHLSGADALLDLAARSGIRAIATSPYPDLLSAAASRRPHAEAIAKPFRARDVAEPVAAEERRTGRPPAGADPASRASADRM